MSSSVIIANILRFVLVGLLQVLVLKRIGFEEGGWSAIHVFLYPLCILLLPLKTPKVAVLFIAFVFGLFMDIFYDSPGVHAAALVFMAFLRPIALNLVEPREGYNVTDSPTKRLLGFAPFLQYAAMLLAAHHFFYFSVEAFTFVYILNILWKTVLSFLVSLLFIMIFMLLFDPKE